MSIALPFETIFNSAPIGNYLVSPTPEATILAVNDAFLTATARTREELIGVSFFDAFPENPDDVMTDSCVAALRRSLTRVRVTGMPETLSRQRYPIQITLPDGKKRFDERYWNAVNTPIFDQSGHLVCISHTTVDITEQIKAEASLRETASRLEFILNCAKIGEWYLDLIHDTSYRSLRHDQCFGYTEPIPEWGLAKFLQHVHPQDRAQVRQEFEKAVSGLDDGHVECRVIWPDGSVHWIAAHGSVYGQSGKPTRMAGIVYDITERKQAEEKLRESDRRKDEFLAMLAHELRNPLAPISAAAQLLKLVRDDEARVAQTCDIIIRQVQHMTSLVDDLLDVSRVTRGMVELEKAPLDVRRIVAEAVEQINPLIHARRHQLVLHVPPQLAVVSGDKKRLVQVMANLLSNAAKYTPEGGHIALQTQVLPDQVILSVEDDGIGMAPELVARVFELFSQAERSSDRSSGGLGLGLALVKSLVELHGGKVVCTSPGPGKGSRFTVCLPRLVDSNGPVERRQSPRYSLRTGKPLKIMVVDDNADAAQTLAMFLQASGHQVIVEHHPMLALETARLEQPDVYMLDIGLPEMDGNELARRLRAQPETARSIMIAVTGYGQEHDRQESIAAGFNHHMTKPIDTARLSTVLAALSPVKAVQPIQSV